MKKHRKVLNSKRKVLDNGWVIGMVLRLFDGRYSLESKIQIIFGYLLGIFGLIALFSALPRPTPNIIDLKFFTINVGTELDLIRLIIGIVLLYIAYKILKIEW